MIPACLRWGTTRSIATAAASASRANTYPFSKTAIIPPPEPTQQQQQQQQQQILPSLRRGKGLMPYLHQTLASPDKQKMLQTLFARHSKERLYVGSVVSVTTDHAPGVFTGVLLAIRRRGLDTSFVVRNIIQRTGVEMQFFVNSPHLKEVKLVRKPPKGRMRRAKLYYLRDSAEKMSSLAGAVRKK